MAGIATLLDAHGRIGLDTSVFIHQLESESRFRNPANDVFEAIAAGRCLGVTSVLTIMELLVKPLQMGRHEVADDYQLLVGMYPNLTIALIDKPIARLAAELRAKHRLSPPDALHIATCLGHGATAFVTNDRQLRRVDELDIVLLEDFVDT